MGFQRWLGAILISSMLVFTGCTQSGTTAETTPAATTTTAPAEQPEETAEQSEEAAEEAPSEAAQGEPPTGDPLEDLADAEGMEGYEEVMTMEVVESSPDSIALGRELFVTNCASCHGEDGSGGGPAAAALDPPPRNLHKSGEYKYGALDLGVYRTTAYGIDGTGMAPWEGILSSDEIWSLVHFVRSEQTS